MTDDSMVSMSSPVLPSLRDLAARVFRKRGVFVFTVAAVLLLCLGTGQFKRTYQAEMGVLVRKERVDAVLTSGPNSTPNLQQVEVSEQDLNSEVELLKDPALLQQVALTAGLVPAGTQDGITLARAVRRLSSHLDIEAVPKTEVIHLRYSSADPQQAQHVLDTLGTLYLKKHQELRGSNHEISFFDERVREHTSALTAAEAKLLAFTQTTGVVSASLERDLTVQQMKNTTQQEIEARAARAYAAHRSDFLRQSLAQTPDRIATEVKLSENAQLLEHIKTTLLNLQLKRANLLAKYDPQYRLVRDTDAEIALAQQALADQAKAPLTESVSDVNPLSPKLHADAAESGADQDGLRAKAASLASSASGLAKEAVRLQTLEVEQAQLLQNVKLEQDALELFRDKRNQAQMAASLDQRGILNVVIAQPPVLPVLPVRSPLTVAAAALVSALLLGLCAAFLADLFDPTIRSAAELEDVLHVPFVEEFEPYFPAARGVA